MTVCGQVSTIEFSLVEKDSMFGLAQGNAVLKTINKELNLEMVEQLMSDTAEGVAYQAVRLLLAIPWSERRADFVCEGRKSVHC